MPTLLGRFSDHLYAMARIVIGLLFACHGAQKLFGVLGGTWQLGDAEGLFAGSIELVGGSLVALGLASSIAAFVASGEMAVAYFRAHAPIGFWPIQNGGEWAVLYCFFFLYVAAQGSGRFSLDAFVRRRRAALESAAASANPSARAAAR
jgi:putative oxidoreductase